MVAGFGAAGVVATAWVRAMGKATRVRRQRTMADAQAEQPKEPAVAQSRSDVRGLVVPARIMSQLVRFGLLTDLGKALWEGYITDRPGFEQLGGSYQLVTGDGQVLPTPPSPQPPSA